MQYCKEEQFGEDFFSVAFLNVFMFLGLLLNLTRGYYSEKQIFSAAQVKRWISVS